MHIYSKEHGFFYLIQLQPESRPDEFKIGYSRNIERKMYECKLYCPQSILMNVWPCLQEWENDAVIYATGDIFQVSNRVYRGDLYLIIDKLTAFFDSKFSVSEESMFFSEEELEISSEYVAYMKKIDIEVADLNK